MPICTLGSPEQVWATTNCRPARLPTRSFLPTKGSAGLSIYFHISKKIACIVNLTEAPAGKRSQICHCHTHPCQYCDVPVGAKHLLPLIPGKLHTSVSRG